MDNAGLREHELKCWPEFFARIVSGEKTFEARRDDRGFRGGDVLWLREWSQARGYSGRELRVRVTYLLGGDWPGLQPGFVVMAIKPVEGAEAVAARTRPQWQPIETAPKDGTPIVVSDGQLAAVVRWSQFGPARGFWQLEVCGVEASDDGFEGATLWQPIALPVAPGLEEAARDE